MSPERLVVDATTASNLIADQFPALAGAEVRILPVGGTESTIARIGADLTARFPVHADDPVRVAGRLRAQLAATDAFAAASTVPAPRARGMGRPGHGYPLPWTLQTWVQGDVATPVSSADAVELARDLAALIRSLRRVPTGGRRFGGEGRGGALTDHDGWVAECLERSADLLDVPALGGMWTALRTLPQTGAPVMSHTDLIPANLLATEGRLVGVLDAGGFQPADPALDLVCAWHLFDADARAVLREEVGCSHLEWLRGAAWALEQALGLVWFYERTNPPMAALGRSTLARLLADDEVREA